MKTPTDTIIKAPRWAFWRPDDFNDCNCRYTPLSGKYSDADWVEAREYGDLTYGVSLWANVISYNTTPLSCYEGCKYTLKWVVRKPPLWRRLFTLIKPFQYWIPYKQGNL